MKLNDRILKLPKWAQVHIASLVSELSHTQQLLRATQTSENVEPDVNPPESSCELSRGYIALFKTLSPRPTVDPACSSCVGHGIGSHTRINSQGARCLYSSPALALKALRYEVEQEYLNRLAAIDKAISAAENESTSTEIK